MLRAILIGLLGGCALLACADADEGPPPRKPGLWEMTMTPEAGASKSMRLCVDEATEAQMMALGPTKGENCKSHQAHREGATFVMDSVCEIMGSEQTSHSVTTYDGDGAYRTVIEAHYNPPFLGKAATTLTQTGKWLGDCGADLKPGEALVNGVRINALRRP